MFDPECELCFFKGSDCGRQHDEFEAEADAEAKVNVDSDPADETDRMDVVLKPLVTSREDFQTMLREAEGRLRLPFEGACNCPACRSGRDTTELLRAMADQGRRFGFQVHRVIEDPVASTTVLDRVDGTMITVTVVRRRR